MEDKEKVKNKGGRPTKLTKEIGDLICGLIEEGWVLSQICSQEGYPPKSTIMRWNNGEGEIYDWFRDRYARAMQIRFDTWGEEIVQIADDGTNDWMERELASGETIDVPNREHLDRSRLRIDTRKWLMARGAPRKYGDKQTHELTGKDGASLTPVINLTIGERKEPSGD